MSDDTSPVSWPHTPPPSPPIEDLHPPKAPAPAEAEGAAPGFVAAGRVWGPVFGVIAALLVLLWVTVPSTTSPAPTSLPTTAPPVSVVAAPPAVLLVTGVSSAGVEVEAAAVALNDSGSVVLPASFVATHRDLTAVVGTSRFPLISRGVDPTVDLAVLRAGVATSPAPVAEGGGSGDVSCAYADSGRLVVASGRLTATSVLIVDSTALFGLTGKVSCSTPSVLLDASGAVVGFGVAGSSEPFFVPSQPAWDRLALLDEEGAAAPAGELPFSVELSDTGSLVVTDAASVDGVAAGDVVTDIDGFAPADSVSLSSYVASRLPGTEMTVSLTRGTATLTAQVKVA